MQGDLKETSTDVLKAVVPVVLIVLLLNFTLLGMPASIVGRFLIGAILVTAGLILFLLGLKVSILPMGEVIGSELPQIGSVPLILLWTFLLGYTATMAEPPVRVLASYVEHASDGEVSSLLLIAFTALGIGLFMALAILRIFLGIPMAYLFAGGYIFILILSFFTPAQFLSIAFDAGGTTTGPVTVPVILSLGVGVTSVLGGKSSVADGFGLVGLASMGPVMAVMLMGVLLG